MARIPPPIEPFSVATADREASFHLAEKRRLKGTYFKYDRVLPDISSVYQFQIENFTGLNSNKNVTFFLK